MVVLFSWLLAAAGSVMSLHSLLESGWWVIVEIGANPLRDDKAENIVIIAKEKIFQ